MTPRRFAAGAGRARRSLALRLGLPLCVGAAVILIAGGAWNLHLQEIHLTHLVSVSADRIAETIRRSTRDAMLRNDADGIHRTIAYIGAEPGIARIRIFNKEGVIRSSTDAAEVGRQVDKSAEQCYACHQRDRPLTALDRVDRVRIFRATSGERVLGVVAPIHNEVQCTTACHVHPASQLVLGVLDVQLSMASVNEALAASEWQMGGSFAVTVAAVLALAGLLLWRMVLRPVVGLQKAMARVASGELETLVPVTSRDEIGQVAEAWNRMTGDLRRARQELEEGNRTLEDRVAEKTQELDRAYQKMVLVEKMASLGKLSAIVAHEINNPLAGIRTFARLLRRRLTGSPETQRILEVIDAEAGRCGEIVRNLLRFGRSTPPHFAEEDLMALLERCRVLLRHQAEAQGIELALDPEAGLPRVVCDASQVQQAVLALAINGLEATPPGGQVTFGARVDGDAVALTVADTGGGIPPEIRDRVFEPFFTTKEAGKGVGLGLAVVYGIVARHHGRITVAPRPGGGTAFTVRLLVHPPLDGGGEEAS